MNPLPPNHATTLREAFRICTPEPLIGADINDAEYTDLYLLIIKKVADELYKLGAKFDKQILNSFESWFKEVMG